MKRGDDINKKEVISNILFSRLSSMTLRSLPQLTSVCSEVKTSSSMQERQKPLTSSQEINLEDELNIPTWLFNGKVLFPDLRVLRLSAINVEKIWRNQLSEIFSCIQNLTRLTVDNCPNLKQIFSSSIVNSFVQLEFLEIQRCPLLEEIVVIEDSREERKNVIFPQLNLLRIEDLENLRRFDAGNCIQFPSLKQLYIEKCLQFKAFWDYIACPSLEVLDIYKMDNLKMIWHDQLVEDSFCKLKSVNIHTCPKLLTVFPSKLLTNMCGRFLRLDTLRVSGCSSVEEIFDLQGLIIEETHSIAATQLRKLDIDFFPKLKHIWNKDPQGLFFFGRLQGMMVSFCESLTYILPASVAKSLLELKDFHVKYCTEEIVAKENGEQEELVRFVFPQMTSLEFGHLRELRTFYAGKHTVEGPVLKSLELYGCHKVKTFTEEFLSFHETNELDQLDMPVEQPLFLVEKAFPILEELVLSEKDITTVCQGQVLLERLCRKLKFLELRVDNSSEVLSVDILQKFKNLETLKLSFCSYKEIFHAEVDKCGGTFAQLKSLFLSGLDNLKYVWTHEQVSKLEILQNLEILQLVICSNLVNLTPASVSFQNLTHLRVLTCDSLINLLTSSTAKSLVQLVEMNICGCKMMTEVVADDGDTIEEENLLLQKPFRKLKKLVLYNLWSLTCFCSGNYNFKFPLLENLLVDRCPKLKICSQRFLTNPRLLRNSRIRGRAPPFEC